VGVYANIRRWEIVELRKLDVSHNCFKVIPEEMFLPLSELQVYP